MLMPKQFHCYLVQKTESVFHPAKLASGANYPVGWVQMPHSVRSVRGCTGQGQRLRGVEGELTPRCAVSVLVSLWPLGSEPLQGRGFLSPGFYPARFFVFCFFCCKEPQCSFAVDFKLKATQYNHNHPPVADEPTSTKGSGWHGRKQNPSVSFYMTLKTMTVLDF